MLTVEIASETTGISIPQLYKLQKKCDFVIKGSVIFYPNLTKMDIEQLEKRLKNRPKIGRSKGKRP